MEDAAAADDDDDADGHMASTAITSEVDPDYDFMGAGRRALLEAEMDAPGFRRYLMADIDRLKRTTKCNEDEIARLREVDKTNAVLVERIAAKNRQRRTNTAIFGLSCAGIGLAPSVFSTNLPALGMVILLAVAAFVSGMERL